MFRIPFRSNCPIKKPPKSVLETLKSYTHWEYAYAGEIGKPRFSVVIKDGALEIKVRRFDKK